MRMMKKSMAYALVAAMVVTLVPANVAGAAKKVKLNRKTAPVEVGKTVKIKVQNAKKTAKVTWKSSKAKVAKIKKSTKKGNASATIAGVKKGKATITATVKTGKKKNVLKCQITVKNAVTPIVSQPPVTPPSTTQPVVSNQPTATVQPSEGPKQTPTKRPSPTPKPSPTPSPTPMPVKEFKFDEVTNGIPIDVSTFEKIGDGSGAYNKDTARVEINDTSAADNSQGTWVLPETVPVIQEGDVVTFRVQGYNYGTSGFRFWIGSGTSGGCTPVLLANEIDETLKIGESGYPEVVEVEEEGEKVSKTMNQMQLVLDEETKAFDVTFSFKAGTSQNDTNGAYPNLTLKYIMSGGTSGYIDGLCIKNIYYITGDGPIVPKDDPLPALDENAKAVVGQAEAVKTDTAITVDGTVDSAWNFADYVKADYYSAEAGETKAQTKFMWDADNLYVLAVVSDPSVDATSNNDYECDGVEVYLDEDNSKEETYDANTDAFQYRFTGFKKGEDGVWADAVTAKVTAGNTEDYNITSAYKAYEGGYVVEMAIPFKDKAVAEADKVLGFEMTVMDCAEGKRANEIWLTGTDKGAMYQNPSLFGEIKLVEPVPGVDISSAKPLYGNGTVTVNDDGTVTGTGLDGIVLPLGTTINTGDTVEITVYGESGVGTRLWLTDSSNGVCSEQINPMTLGTKCTVTATADNISLFQIKGSAYGVTFDTLKITKVVVKAAGE